MKITFIGLGIMGSRMAANLLKNDVDVTVWNRSEAPVEELKAKGARSAPSANEAVAGADIVFSMLSTPEVVEMIFLEEGGVLSNMQNGAIWVDCSTVNPSFSLRAAAASAPSVGRSSTNINSYRLRSASRRTAIFNCPKSTLCGKYCK